MGKPPTEEFLKSDAYKRQLDEFAQQIGLDFEGMRVNTGSKFESSTSLFTVLSVNEDDVDILDIESGFIVSVQNNDIFKKAGIEQDDMILANIISEVDVNGMTSIWNFKKVSRVV